MPANVQTAATGSTRLVQGAAQHEGGRPAQEDRLGVIEFETADGMPATLAMVADGIGGHNTGERASFLARETILNLAKERSPTATEIPVALSAMFSAANTAIYRESLADESRAGMGTTCTAVVIIGNRLYVAHVGDSRAYLIRRGAIHQLTIDHTWAEEALQAGRSPDEIRNHPNRGVIKRFLGINETVSVDTRYRPFGAADGRTYADAVSQPLFLEPGDSILLTTDGIPDVLEDKRLLSIVRRSAAPEAADSLVQAALKAGAADNVTAIVLDLPGGKKSAGRPPLAVLVAAAILLVALGAGLAALAAGNGTDAPTATPAVLLSDTATALPTRASTATQPAGATPGGGVIVATGAPTATATTEPTQTGAGEGMATAVPTFTTVPTPAIPPTAVPPTLAPDTPTPESTPTATATAPPAPTATQGSSGGGGGGSEHEGGR